jgi:hypothetical protein
MRYKRTHYRVAAARQAGRARNLEHTPARLARDDVVGRVLDRAHQRPLSEQRVVSVHLLLGKHALALVAVDVLHLHNALRHARLLVEVPVVGLDREGTV